jgi:DNA-binding CsgD family transcriptional regulator
MDRLTTDGLAHAIGGVGIAEALEWRGQLREAITQIGRVFAHLESLARPSITDASMAATVGISALAELAATARARGESAEEFIAEGERLLSRMTEHTPVTRVGKMVYEQRTAMLLMHTTRLTAEMHRLRGEDSPALWEAAVDAASGFAYAASIARWRWASALLTAGSRDEAAAQLLLAHGKAVELGARPLQTALAALARRGRIALPGLVIAPETDLTPRELAVLELVATGMTNKQVGDQLYISQKTASVHLSRAMAKLGAANRTEVVSIAHDRGLLS